MDLIRTRIDGLSELITTEIIELKDYRDLMGYSQASIAQIIGVNRSTIDYIEREGYETSKRKEIEIKIKKRLNLELKKYETRYDEINSLLNKMEYY